MHLPTDDVDAEQYPRAASTSLRTVTRASSKSNPVGTFCLLTSNPRHPKLPLVGWFLNTRSRRERGAPEVQTDAQGANQQDPRALAQYQMRATSTPLDNVGVRRPGNKPANRTVVWQSPDGSFLSTTLLPGVYGRGQSPEGTSSKPTAKYRNLALLNGTHARRIGDPDSN